MEVLCKTVTGILNRCLTAVIQFHNTLHNFRADRGMGTVSLESNLPQQMMDMGEEVPHGIFLDLHKVYDALECGRSLDFLTAYGVGPWALLLLWRYWDILTMVARKDGYFEAPLKVQRGVNQGDPLSPMIINIVVDVDLWNWLSVVEATF